MRLRPLRPVLLRRGMREGMWRARRGTLKLRAKALMLARTRKRWRLLLLLRRRVGSWLMRRKSMPSQCLRTTAFSKSPTAIAAGITAVAATGGVDAVGMGSLEGVGDGEVMVEAVGMASLGGAGMASSAVDAGVVVSGVMGSSGVDAGEARVGVGAGMDVGGVVRGVVGGRRRLWLRLLRLVWSRWAGEGERGGLGRCGCVVGAWDASSSVTCERASVRFERRLAMYNYLISSANRVTM